jgi:hypothetical protein
MYPRVDWVRWVENSPTPPFAQPFTARIKVHHAVRRNDLTISIGVEGQQAFVVWDRPCQTVAPDNSLDLTLDVPLPAYAARFWPPNEDHQWYVEVTDHSPATAPAAVGMVEEITLVRRVITPSNQCIPSLFRPSAREFPLQRGGTVRIFIPSKKRYVLTLGVDHTQVSDGSMVTFRGQFFLEIDLSNVWNMHAPQNQRSINIFKGKYDPIEQYVQEGMIGSATTGTDGCYTLGHVPTETAIYQATITKPDYTVIASSNFIEVRVIR